MNDLPGIETRFGPYISCNGGVELHAPVKRADGSTEVLTYPLDLLALARLAEGVGQASALLMREASEELRTGLPQDVIRRVKRAAKEDAKAP